MYFKHFTILEENSDSNSPMIGTIDKVSNTKRGSESFKERFLEAVGEHFDTDDFTYSDIPDLFTEYTNEVIQIEIDGLNYDVRILETWMY